MPKWSGAPSWSTRSSHVSVNGPSMGLYLIATKALLPLAFTVWRKMWIHMIDKTYEFIWLTKHMNSKRWEKEWIHIVSKVWIHRMKGSYKFIGLNEQIWRSQWRSVNSYHNRKKRRHCENIPTWISLSGDLAFSHQHGIYCFKFPKRFSEFSRSSLRQRPHFIHFIHFIYFIDPNHLKNWLSTHRFPTFSNR